MKTNNEVEPAEFLGPPKVAGTKLVGRGKTEYKASICEKQISKSESFDEEVAILLAGLNLLTSVIVLKIFA